MCFSPEINIFIFIARPARSEAFISQINTWAASLQPWLRLYLADPCVNEPVMKDFGLATSDAPTAVADDTRRSRSFRFKDQATATGPALDMEAFRKWLIMLAKGAGHPSPQLR
eukprot:gnl/TRDRNA2_/TRDRNA2_80364_c0_seq2.p3 gnl/TRDRNA2_/TRDRNA2_80364_c0~~gnl/TRDRNA2_/TRDRNA2_80364_c0_seq2.p3  ORF type:complete len:113 (-),score=14.99 gnl/TRDRNA2_/TRDRNA2_80364_c0_seq2:38-376(-)